MIFFRSLLFSIGSLVATLIIGSLSFLTFPFPYISRFYFVRSWAMFNLWWLEVTCNIRYEVTGIENIPKTNAIVFCKHQSTFETIVLQKLIIPHTWVLKRELLWLPFFGWGLAALEPVAIDRSSGRKAVEQIKQQGIDRLNKGRWIVIFPEGTRVPAGTEKRFGIGGAILAAESGYPVLPITHNAGRHWPRKSFLKFPGTIQVHIGQIIETKGRTPDEINQAAKQWIDSKTREIGG